MVNEKDTIKSNRLIDSFAEIITYISYFNKNLKVNQPDFDSVKSDIDNLFKRSEEMIKEVKIKHIDWKKACFPICAWVDENILCSEWSDKDKWRNNQLQLRFFKTTNAGALFFEKLDHTDSKEIREVFAYCLALGFRGKYFSNDDMIELSEIKAENLLLYFSDDDDMNIPQTLFPEAYNKLKSTKKRRSNFFSTLFYLFFIVVPPTAAIFIYYLYKTKLNSILSNIKIIW